MSYQDNRIFTLNEPNAPRLNPALACEIGLNESLLLLQIEFFISVSGIEKDGQKWIFNSTRDIRDKWFPFWSHHTINRAIKSLENKKLIDTTTRYNKAKYDKTRWFTLNYQGLSGLESIAVKGYATRSEQNETGSEQNATGSNQYETTIQETKKETLKRDDVQAPPENEPAPVIQEPKETPSSPSYGDQLITVLAGLFSLIPKKHLKPSVKKTIEKALIIHSEDYIKSAIQYTNDHSNGHSWQKYRAYLDKTINHGYADGYQSETKQVDQEAVRKEFEQMPDGVIQTLADTGNTWAVKELKRRKK